MSVTPATRPVIIARTLLSVALVAAAIACSDDSTSPNRTFLEGTSSNHQIGVVVNSLGKSLTLFQLGSTTTQEEIPLGASSSITPTGLAVRGHFASVPLGNTASVALVDLSTQAISRVFTFESGNTTGSTFSNDTTLFVNNSTTGVVGRATLGQSGDAITVTDSVAPAPTAITVSGNRVLVTSANLDENFSPIGNGIVTAIDAGTMEVLGTATTGGTNSTDAALGPDGMLYVVNTGDYVSEGSLTIVNPTTMAVVQTVPNMGVGPGAIYIDANGLAYISNFNTGTLVWSTVSKTFVRDESNPVCAKVAGVCRGAFAATTNSAGDIYQVFFGSAADNEPPYVFVYTGSSYTLSDSVATGSGPTAINIKTY